MQSTDEKLSQIIQVQSVQGKKLDRLYTALLGDEAFKTPGLVDKVGQHDEWIIKEKKAQWRRSGITGGIMFVIGLLASLVKDLFR